MVGALVGPMGAARGSSMQTQMIQSDLTSVRRACTVYPELCLGKKSAGGKRTRKASAKMRGLSLAAAASCLVALAAIAVVLTESNNTVVAGLRFPEIKLKGMFGSAKNYHLLSVSSESQRRDVQGQIHYVAQIIGQVSKAPHEARRLALTIVEQSLRAKYDPLFVAAVIKSESLFKKNAKSHVGARGLMQLMPTTAKFVAESQSSVMGGEGNLNDPDYNLRIGIAYLKHLEDMFDGNQMHALIAYNWGPGNLNQALQERGRIPSSTVQYASKILATHRRWKRDFDSRRADAGFISEAAIARG